MSQNTTVFRAHLLLGDMLYSVCTVARYAREHPDENVVVECLNEYPQEVWDWVPGVRRTHATDTPCERRYEFDVTAAMRHAVQHKCGIWKSMGAILDLPTDDVPQLSLPDVEIPQAWKGAFVISPFSRSCTSHQGLPANKTFSTATWVPLIRHLKRRGKILFVSGSEEYLPDMHLDESERVAGFSLSVVASVFRHARCVLSVDNGLARLATLAGANTMLLYPEFLPLEVFAPVEWSKQLRVIQIDPQIPVVNFTVSLKSILKQYIGVL